MKTIAFLLALGCGLAALALLSWPGQAQEQPLPPAPALSPAQVDALWEEAQQLVAQGQAEAGADRYMTIATTGPVSLRSVNAALRAGHCYLAANRPDRAIECYDSVQVMANSHDWSTGRDRTAANGLRSGAVCAKARIFEETGRDEEAAQLYGSLVSEVMSRKGPLENVPYNRAADTMERAGLAAKCLERANKPAEAVWYYNAILALAESKTWEDDPREFQTVYAVQNTRAQALCSKANACVQAGSRNDALAAVRQMRTEFADCPAASEMAILEAQLTGDSIQVQQARELSSRESAACELLKQIAARRGPAAAPNDTLEQLDYIVRTYPGTSAALRALEAEGRFLKKHGRYAEADRAFAALIERLGGETAFRSRLYQTARIQLAETRIKDLRARQLQRQPIADQEWHELRALCSDIKTRGLRKLDRATAHFLLIECCAMQDRLDELLAESDEFRVLYGSPQEIKKRELLHMWVNYFSGAVHVRRGEYAKALDHFRWVIHYHEATRKTPPYENFMPLMYYRIWDVLRRARAPEDQIDSAATDLLIRFPDSEAARSLTSRPANYAE